LLLQTEYAEVVQQLFVHKQLLVTAVADQERVSQVFKGIKDGVHDVAIKLFKSVTTARDLELLQTEIAVLRSCNNRNIVHFYGVSFKGSDAWLVMELLEKGNLYNALAYGKGLCTWYNRYSLLCVCNVAIVIVVGMHTCFPVRLLC